MHKFAIVGSRRDVAEKLESLLQAKNERRPIPDKQHKLGPFKWRWLDEVARPTLRASIFLVERRFLPRRY